MEQIKEIIVGVVKKGEKFLILHRQSNKKFDPNKWEFISGFVKGKADLKKYVIEQIKKETVLNVEFIKFGKDFTVDDEYGMWSIHPFLFKAIKDNVVLQYKDHLEYKWVLAEDLKFYSTVKDLDKNLASLNLL